MIKVKELSCLSIKSTKGSGYKYGARFFPQKMHHISGKITKNHVSGESEKSLE